VREGQPLYEGKNEPDQSKIFGDHLR
jgi:hypothetical protein